MPSQIRAGTPLAALAVALAMLLGVAGLSSPAPTAAMTVVLLKLITCSWPAAAYLLGAIGLGRAARPLFAGAADELLVQAGVGLALMLTLSHLLGQLGVVGGTPGLIGAWAPVAVGLGLLAHQAMGMTWSSSATGLGERAGAGGSRAWGLIDWAPVMLATAVMVVAACNPPGGLTGQDYGGLWGSEFGGFDALSYHLPLPQEWLAMGRVAPLSHNVYSFLPGYMEAAFLHVSVLSGAGLAKAGAGGLLADEGWRLITCQILHAGMGVLTTAGVVRLVRAWSPGGDAVGGRLAASLAAATPWTVVVGSLAYNELAVTALSAPLLLVAADDRLAPWRRGVIAGLILAAAASVKPPAAFLLGAPAAVLMLAGTPRRRWPGMVLCGAVAGLAVMAPWLVRNWQACGNPVFPYAHGLLGSGAWTAAQFERYAAAHHESASFLERLVMMFAKPAGSAQHRGVLHPQWALFFPAVVLLGAMAARSAARTMAAKLAVGLGASVVLWLTLTHVQSRFLMPLLVPGGALAGLGLASGVLPGGMKRGAAWLVGAGQAAAAVAIFAAQSGGQPGAGLAWMPADAAGESLRGPLSRAGSAERLEFFTKQATPLLYVNLALPAGSKVYLLGDATPLYFTTPVLYNTVWDRWPLLEAMEMHPGDARAQAGNRLAELRRRGVTHVLLNVGEVARYRASGYSDPALTLEAVVDALVGRAREERRWGPPDRPAYILFNISNVPSGVAWGRGGAGVGDG